MDSIEVEEITLSAEKYLSSLEDLEDILNNAQVQINASAKATNYTINKQFDALKEELIAALDKRKAELLKKLTQVKSESLQPINDSQKLLSGKISTAKSIIQLGNSILKSPDDGGDCSLFNKASNELYNLPEVPELKYVPNISFVNNIVKDHYEYMHLIPNFGSISKIAPVQIGAAIEKPGSVLLKFKNTDDDFAQEITEYRLQITTDYVIGMPNIDLYFKDIYMGPSDEFLAKKLTPNTMYSFRVCCKLQGCLYWSPWSAIEKTSTSLTPYEWFGNDSFVLSENNTIAHAIKTSDSSLISKTICILDPTENSLEFMILDMGSDLQNNFLGLVSCESIDESLKLNNVKGTILVEMTGDVYMDGIKKATKLDSFKIGSKLTFVYQQTSDNLQIHIDLNEKRLTYFWNMLHETFVFGAKFTSSKWKVRVQ